MSAYAFVQKLIDIKVMGLDNDDHLKNSQRYRTRVEANAAALELVCLSYEDEKGTTCTVATLCRSKGVGLVVTWRVIHTNACFLDSQEAKTGLFSMYSVEMGAFAVMTRGTAGEGR